MRLKESHSTRDLMVILVGAILALFIISCSNPTHSSYTVTFDPNGGTLTGGGNTVVVATGSPVQEPDAPTRSGYTFDGWYLKGSEEKYDFSLPIIADITLEARWTAASGGTPTPTPTPTPPPTPTSYTVTYHAMVDGVESDTITVPESSTVQSGSMLQVPATPTYDNTEYSFVGWSTSGTEYIALASDHVVQGNLDLWAVFVKKSSTGTSADGMLSYTFDEAKRGYTITGTDSATGAISIPSTINGAPVVEIPADAFSGNTSITSIDLSKATNLKTIGNVAFGFMNIKELTIPGNVETVGSWIVEGCSSLASLTIEEGVKTLSESSFYGAAVKTIKIPSTITEIPVRCFEASAIESIELHNGITSIGDAAFMNCSNLTALTIPGSVTHIGQWILRIGNLDSSNNWIPNPNTSITVTIEEGATGLSASSFWGSPISSISIPSTIKAIPEYCFSNSTLSHIKIKGSIKTIGISAFYNCSNLSSIDLTGVESIGESAFAYTGIKSIHIPKSVASIGSWAFQRGGWGSSRYDYEPGDSLEVTFDKGFNGFGVGSFNYAPVKEVEIPSSVTEIPQSCFYGSLISKATLPEGLKTIATNAFYMSELTEITLPSTLEIIGPDAFDANDITSVVLPKSLTELDVTAFSYPYNSVSTDGVRSITVQNDNPESITITGTEENNQARNCIVYVPDTAVDLYRVNTDWCAAGRFDASNIQPVSKKPMS